jgi:hypothetical protein
MNKKFVMMALFGALTFDHVMAARLEKEDNLLELNDDDDMYADVESFAPKKKPAIKAKAEAKKAKAAAGPQDSNDDSTSDDERHEAYKDGERNSATTLGAKNQKHERKAAKGGAEKKDKEDKPHVRAQTLESLQ